MELVREPVARRLSPALWLLSLALLYGGIALLFATERIAAFQGRPGAPSWTQSLCASAAPWSAWFLLTPAIVWLTRRFPLEGPALRRSLTVHAEAMVGLSLVQAFLNIGIGVLLSIAFEGYTTTWRELVAVPPAFLLSISLRNPLLYAVIVGMTSTVDYYRKYRVGAVREARLESQLAQAQFRVLQSQLQPHFLFNTLNAIATLLRRDADAAEAMLVRLADLLRGTLAGGESQEIPLSQELDLLDAYLAIERVRFSDRLSVRRDLDPSTLDEPVPRLLLQPLAENAIRHGLTPKRGPWTLWVGARRVGGTLEICVADDGVGPGQTPAGGGVGLANTRARLRALYGEGAELSLSPRQGGGAEAIVRIPGRPGEASR